MPRIGLCSLTDPNARECKRFSVTAGTECGPLIEIDGGKAFVLPARLLAVLGRVDAFDQAWPRKRRRASWTVIQTLRHCEALPECRRRGTRRHWLGMDFTSGPTHGAARQTEGKKAPGTVAKQMRVPDRMSTSFKGNGAADAGSSVALMGGGDRHFPREALFREGDRFVGAYHRIRREVLFATAEIFRRACAYSLPGAPNASRINRSGTSQGL